MRLVVSVLPLLVFVLGVADATAQQKAPKPSSHERATLELFNTMEMKNTFEETVEASLQQVVQQNPGMQQYMGVMREFFAKYMSWESLEGEMAEIYMKAFNEKEIRELTAFYKTPIGRKAALMVPQLTAEGMAIGQRRVQANMGELQRMVEARQKELAGQ